MISRVCIPRAWACCSNTPVVSRTGLQFDSTIGNGISALLEGMQVAEQDSWEVKPVAIEDEAWTAKGRKRNFQRPASKLDRQQAATTKTSRHETVIFKKADSFFFTDHTYLRGVEHGPLSRVRLQPAVRNSHVRFIRSAQNRHLLCSPSRKSLARLLLAV